MHGSGDMRDVGGSRSRALGLFLLLRLSLNELPKKDTFRRLLVVHYGVPINDLLGLRASHLF